MKKAGPRACLFHYRRFVAVAVCRWMPCYRCTAWPRAASAASITASLIVGCGCTVAAIWCAVAPSCFRQRGFGEHLRYIGPHHVGAQQSVGFRIENQLDKPVSVACGRCLSGSRIGELSDFDFVTAFDGLFLRQPDHGDFRRSVDT